MTHSSNIAELHLELCIGCGVCVDICPTKAIPTIIIGYFSTLTEIIEEKCNGCGECIKICPHHAIRLLNRNNHSKE